MKKKILFLITKSNWGGAQRYVYDLATALDQEKYELVVALGGDGELKEKLDAATIRTAVLPAMSNTFSPKKLWSIVSETTTFLQTEQPDILHCNSSIAGFAGVVAGRRASVPQIIFTAHGWAFNENRPLLQRVIFCFFHWLTVLISHRTIAVSHEIKRQLPQLFLKRKWHVIHNGRREIDFLPRSEARERFGVESNTLLSGTVGELHPIKQHEVTIKALAELKKARITLTHLIVGAGLEGDTLKQLASELQVSDQIIFAGHIHEAARYLTACDIYIQPSRSEALGYTVIEAAQAGLPIIASRVGGIPEIISDGETGLLVPSGDIPALTSAIKSLITNKEERVRMGQAAELNSERFSFSTMLEKTIALYDSNTMSSANAESAATD